MVETTRSRALTIVGVRVAWLGVVVLYWHTDGIPSSDLAAGLEEFRDGLRAVQTQREAEGRAAPGRTWCGCHVSPTRDLHVSVCLWRDARWAA